MSRHSSTRLKLSTPFETLVYLVPCALPVSTCCSLSPVASGHPQKVAHRSNRVFSLHCTQHSESGGANTRFSEGLQCGSLGTVSASLALSSAAPGLLEANQTSAASTHPNVSSNEAPPPLVARQAAGCMLRFFFWWLRTEPLAKQRLLSCNLHYVSCELAEQIK